MGVIFFVSRPILKNSVKTFGLEIRAFSNKVRAQFSEATLSRTLMVKKTKVDFTLDNLEKMEELIINLNPAAWYLSPITENGRANENSYLFENITQYENKIRKISKNVEERGIVVKVVDIVLDKNELNNFSFDCGASLAHCEIHADGTVSPCTLSRITMHNKYLSFPNIKNQTLKQIWDSEQFNKFRSYQTMGCSGCRSFKNCNRIHCL